MCWIKGRWVAAPWETRVRRADLSSTGGTVSAAHELSSSRLNVNQIKSASSLFFFFSSFFKPPFVTQKSLLPCYTETFNFGT